MIEDLDDSVYSGFIIRFRDFNLLNLSYKEYCFYEEKFRKRLIDNSTVSANTNINQDALKNLALAFPPTVAEQKAIAQSLSDVDALITECDRLITKKRNIKQGTMQQLLTAKKRLPGFNDEWLSIRVDSVAKVTTGDKDTKDRVQDGKYPFFVRSQIVERINTFSFDGEAVLTAGDGVGVGKVYHYINGKFDFHQRVYMIYDFDGYDGIFFFYYFLNHFLMEAKLPEQKAIAQILRDMDAEIEALEQKRDKYKAIKQGMMQELLTGKTRLIGSY